MASSTGSTISHHTLLLSLAHTQLSHNILQSLIRKTSSTCHTLLNNNESGNEQNNASTTIHLYLTASPKISKPGKSLQDWETQWTAGEKVWADLVNSIGLNYFSNVKPKRTKLVGRLVDVAIDEEDHDVSQPLSPKSYENKFVNKLQSDYNQSLTMVLQDLKLKSVNPYDIEDMYIIVPCDNFCEIGDIETKIENFFQALWSNTLLSDNDIQQEPEIKTKINVIIISS